MKLFGPGELHEATQFYKQSGFAVFPNVVEQSRLDELKRAANRIVNQFDIEKHRSVFSTGDQDRGRDDYFMASAEAVHCFLEEHAIDDSGELTKPREQSINKIGHALHDHIPEFGSLARMPLFADILLALGYQDPELWQTMYIFKQPRIGGQVRWHQDASYLDSSPTSVIGFWLALEDATTENGCLWVQPGGHRSPLREIYQRRAGGEAELHSLDTTPWPTQDEAVPVEVAAGSLVIFHDHMPHYSSENRSSRSRQAFTMHFMDGQSEWSAENWLQRPQLGPFVL